MSKINFKSLFLYLTPFILSNHTTLLGNNLNEKDFDSFHEKSIIYSKSVKNNNFIYKKKTDAFEKYLYDDLLKLGENLIYLLSLKENIEKKDFNLDIESDIQYEKDNKFYAEGNVIVYFSNGSLRADTITYNKIDKTLTSKGNVIFSKGKQYFEASKVFYNLKTNDGFIENIYGILNIKSFVDDFEFKNIIKAKKIENIEKVTDLKYINNVSLGLINDFEETKKFNITQLKFQIPSITKWRYKSNKLFLKGNVLSSEEILFTNDALNKPQFILKSKKFTGELVNQKIKLVSKNNWIILDDILKVPIGKRSIFEKESNTSWGIGSDFNEKDGFFLSRSHRYIELNEEFRLKYRTYYLFQRGFKGETNAFTAKDSSLLSSKVKNDIELSDLFGLDVNLFGNLKEWKLSLKSEFNSLNPDRLPEALRTKLSITKSIDLNSHDKNDEEVKGISQNYGISDFDINHEIEGIIKNDELNDFNIKKNNNIIELYLAEDNEIKHDYKNIFDIKFSSVYREKISRGYAGESEIYFGNSLSLANRKLWRRGNSSEQLSFIYDTGQFKAQGYLSNTFMDLYRNVLAIKYYSAYSLWEKNINNKNINKNYKYFPSIVKEGIIWKTNIQSAIFLYSNGYSQEAISFSSGPQITLGSLTNKFFDYTTVNLIGNYVLKSGQSPFAFDDINKNFNVNIELKQQLLGPLVFSYGTSYNFETSEYSLPIYGLDINRRAYNLGAFYNMVNESIGFKFNIFNFDYSGKSSKF